MNGQWRFLIRGAGGYAVRAFLCLLLGACPVMAQDDAPFFTAPGKPVIAGTTASLWLYWVNGASNAVTRPVQPILPAVATAGNGNTNTSISLTNANAGQMAVVVPPGGFMRAEYRWHVPEALTGPVTLAVGHYNAVAVEVDPAPAGAGEMPPVATRHSSIFQAPPEFLTNYLYEPTYFILGTYPAAEFQFSIKYKLFRTATDWNPFGHLYVAYTQTSFWDLLANDPSFYDTSYKPSAFLLYRDLIPAGDFHLDLQPGFEHESNGRGGTGERSLYTAYLQPTATIELPENFQLVLQSRAWVYADVGPNNPDIAKYRGYGWVSGALNWTSPEAFSWADAQAREKMQLALKFETGDSGDHDAWKIDFRFNLAFLPVLSRFTPTVQVQYFTGYGQTLRQYNQYSHGIRAGLCLWY